MAVNGTESGSLDVIVSWTFGFWTLGLRGVELNGLCNVALIALKVALIALVGLLRVIGDMDVEEGLRFATGTNGLFSRNVAPID